MTWLEIMDMLDKMPRHLLKREAELWHYDDEGNYEILPIDDSVSPLNDSAPDEEWGPGGDCRLSLQSFDVDRKPELNEYAVTLRRTIRISVMAQDLEQAQLIGENLAAGSGEFGCQVVNNEMSNGDDEFYGVGPADSAFYHKKLGAEDSMRVLNEKE